MVAAMKTLSGTSSTSDKPASQTANTVGYLNIGNQRDELRMIDGRPYVATCWHKDPIGTDRFTKLTALTPEAEQRMKETWEFCTTKNAFQPLA